MRYRHEPLLRRPSYLMPTLEARGFASPPRDGFAFSYTVNRVRRSIPGGCLGKREMLHAARVGGRSLRPVLPEYRAQGVRDLPDRGELAQSFLHRVEKVLRALRGAREASQSALDGGVVAALPQIGQPARLGLADRLVDRVELHLRVVGLTGIEAVHPDDDAILPLDRALVPVGGVLDLGLHKALLDRADRSAEVVDAPYVLPRLLLDGVGERFDKVRAGQRIGRVGQAALVRQDLLRPQGDPGAPLGRQRERLVESVGVQALGAAEDGAYRLHEIGRAHV